MLARHEIDFQLWEKYNKTKFKPDRDALLKRMDPLIQVSVNKWAGPVPRDVLVNEAKILAMKSFDTYDPNRGVKLSTHVTNNLAPISRVVYTHQNVARLPENILLRTHAYQTALEHITATKGREPTTDELHEELGWSVPEIARIGTQIRKDLVESVGGLDDTFYPSHEQDAMEIMIAVYMSLNPSEKKLFEYTTGFNGHPILKNAAIMRRLGITQSQLSYRKTLLKNKVDGLLSQERSRAR